MNILKKHKENEWKGYFEPEIAAARSKKIPSSKLLDDEWCVSGQEQAATHILPYLNQGSVVLEIACGLGRVSRFVAPHCRLLYCSDILDNALRETRKNLSEIKNVEYVKINGYDLKNFKPDSLDLIYCFGTFFHLDFEVAVNYLVEISRVLKPDGFCVLEFKSFKSKKDVDRLLSKIDKFGIKRHDLNPRKFRYVSSEMLKAICEHLNYKIIKEDLHAFTFQKV